MIVVCLVVYKDWTLKSIVFFFTLDDVHWCALTLGEQKRQLKEINHNGEWSDKVSILVYSLTYDKVSLSFGPWYTMSPYLWMY